MKILLILASIISTQAFAESGNCSGLTTSRKAISISYFTNGYADNNIDYYAKINLANRGEAVYALSVGSADISGEATQKSKAVGLDYGNAILVLSEEKTQISGSIGNEKFELNCTYREN